MIKQIVASLLVMLLLSACVAYPTTRTYFKPDPNDGQLTPSMGCGYHATKEDALIKPVGDGTITVMPDYVSGAKLKITLLVATKTKADAKLQLDGVSIQVNHGTSIYPLELSATEKVPTGDGKGFNQWLTLIFPLTVDEIEAFNLTIPLNGSSEVSSDQGLLNFNFEKVEVSDFYYNSINC